MKILIAAASFSPEMSGIQRHAFNVVRCLLLHPQVEMVHLVVAPWQRELVKAASLGSDERLSIHEAEMSRTSLGRNRWYYHRLPSFAASLNADLVHLSYPMPVRAKAFACPIVVTLHDLYPYEVPRNFGFPKFIFNRFVLRQCLHQVDAIACVSETTHSRLRQYAAASAWDKSVCIYNCVQATPPGAAPAAIPGWHGEPFLLCVAQHRRNKNVALLLRCFAGLLRRGQIDSKTKLFVVGIPGPETPQLNRLRAEHGLEDTIHFLTGLSEPQLQWCYANCDAMVAPSSTEGFGLPIAEALLAGCKVVCSDIPAHREIGGEHCRFVSLEDAEGGLARAIVETLQAPRRAAMSLPQLSASVLAGQYITLYHLLIKSHSLGRVRPVSLSALLAAAGRQAL